MAITTSGSFLELLQKSKLLAPEQLAYARDAARGIEEARALAKNLVQAEMLTRWQAGQLLAGRSSFFLGKYKLIDLVGRGGMGSVFLAEHTTMNRPVALKIIARQLGRDPESLERFFTEARAIAALDHPNIVQAYDVDSEGDRYYIVMEFVEGRDFERIVAADGPLDYAQAADTIRQAAEGLAHAHGRNMVHCDIKPANLLVNGQGVVKILDMGMARLVGRDRDAAAGPSERVLGTVDYLAPEQALESPQLDHRADLYSLGCTLYFLLCGHPPFPEGTLHERILKHQTQEPRPIVETRPDAPADLIEICRKMMAKDPADRFQTAGEVAQLLTDWDPPESELQRALPADDSELPRVRTPEPPSVSPQGGRSSAGSRGTEKLVAACRRAFRRRPRLMLFSGAGAVGGLVLLAVLLVMFVSSGEQAPVDQARPRTAADVQEPGRPEAEPSDAPAKIEAPLWPEIPAPDRLFDPSAVADVGQGAAKSRPAPRRKQPGAKKSASGSPGAKTPARSEATDAKSAPKEPMDKTPLPAKPGSGKPAAEKPAPKKTGPKKTGPGKPASSGQQPGKPEPKKAAKKGLFDGFPEIVELPKFKREPAVPLELGTIHVAADVNWQLLVWGGQNALKSTRQSVREFVLHRTEPEAAKARWVVQLEESSSGGEATTADVANVWRAGEALMFQWAQNADPASANYLRNCILQVRVATKSRYVCLRRPEQIDPVPFDLVRGTTTISTPVEWLPENRNLRVAITQVEGRDGHRVEPAEPAEPATPLGLFFDRTDRHGNTRDRVEFRVIFTARSSGLTCKLQLMDPPATQFRKLQSQNMTVVKSMIARQQNEILKRLNPKDKNKAPKGEERSRLNRQLDELEKARWYIEFFEQVHQKAKLHFRLWTEVDDRELVLASTGAS